MKSKLHTYVAVSISNYKAIFTYTINVVVATNHTDEPVVCGPGYILKMGGYAVMQPMQEHMQGMQTPWGQFHTVNCRLVCWGTAEICRNAILSSPVQSQGG